MKVGSLVEIVDTTWPPFHRNMVWDGFKFPIKGKIYTVREISDSPWGVGIRLLEIDNQHLSRLVEDGKEILFDIKRFRELLPPISINEVLEREGQYA